MFVIGEVVVECADCNIAEESVAAFPSEALEVGAVDAAFISGL